MSDSLDAFDPFTGCLLGTAVGDSLGLPREGLGPGRAARIYGDSPLRQGLFLGLGLVSDDTEHLRMTAVSLLQESTDSSRFAGQLARRLRWWLAALPAGVGLATGLSIIRLWFGWPPDRSGVDSAGNGPAMRSGILGVCLHRDQDPLPEFVRASTRITHTDVREETGAMLIAWAGREAVRSRSAPIDAGLFLQTCRKLAPDEVWATALEQIEQGLAHGDSAVGFAARLQCERGVSGYIVKTVAAVLFCWLRWPGEFRRPIEQIIMLGGDADSTAAVLGGLAGASCGPTAIPPEWLNRLAEWPYSVNWMRSLGQALRRKFAAEAPLTEAIPTASPLPRWLMPLAIVIRNVVFLVIVLGHGLRRLLPPY